MMSSANNLLGKNFDFAEPFQLSDWTVLATSAFRDIIRDLVKYVTPNTNVNNSNIEKLWPKL